MNKTPWHTKLPELLPNRQIDLLNKCRVCGDAVNGAILCKPIPGDLISECAMIYWGRKAKEKVINR